MFHQPQECVVDMTPNIFPAGSRHAESSSRSAHRLRLSLAAALVPAALPVLALL